MFHTVKLADLKHHLNKPKLQDSIERGRLHINLEVEKVSPTFKNFKYSMLNKLVATPNVKKVMHT
jgi:hypothetical protein